MAKPYPQRGLPARMEGRRASCADALPGDNMSGSLGGSGRAQHPPVPGAWGFASLGGICPAVPCPGRRAVGFPVPLARTHGCAREWHLGMGHSYCHRDFRRSAHTPLAPAFFFFFFNFFLFLPFFSPVSIQFRGQKPRTASDRAYK